MSSKREPAEFKIEAVKQMTERGHSAPEVAKRLGVSQPTLYEWIKRYSAPEAQWVEQFCLPVGDLVRMHVVLIVQLGR